MMSNDQLLNHTDRFMGLPTEVETFPQELVGVVCDAPFVNLVALGSFVSTPNEDGSRTRCYL